MKVHSPSFKALENPWTATFKRYFLVYFVGNSAIFAVTILVQDFDLILRQLFRFIPWLIIYSGIPPTCVRTQHTQTRSHRRWQLRAEKSLTKWWECSKVEVEKKQLSKIFFSSTTKWKCLNIKQNTQSLFFKWHDPWIPSRFEIKWVNIYSDNLNNFAQVFVVRNILSLHSLVHVS